MRSISARVQRIQKIDMTNALKCVVRAGSNFIHATTLGLARRGGGVPVYSTACVSVRPHDMDNAKELCDSRHLVVVGCVHIKALRVKQEAAVCTGLSAEEK